MWAEVICITSEQKPGASVRVAILLYPVSDILEMEGTFCQPGSLNEDATQLNIPVAHDVTAAEPSSR